MTKIDVYENNQSWQKMIENGSSSNKTKQNKTCDMR